MQPTSLVRQIALLIGLAAVGLAAGYWLAGSNSFKPSSNPPVASTVDSTPQPQPVLAQPESPRTADANAGRRFALLVGVTKYELSGQRDLVGPGNDVVLIKQMLTSPRFGFADANIVTLSEAMEKPDLRPTRTNIKREFERIAEKARADDQVFILMAGHGSRQPVITPDPEYHQTDGMNEVFLPADTKRASEGLVIPNGIMDTELARWLKNITDKRAYVWAVFDCCHSGTITRSTEVSREIVPGELLPPNAQQKATSHGERSRGGPFGEKRESFLPAKPSEYLVVLSACRASESAPELPLPTHDPNARYHGLLSYTIREVLEQSQGKLNYRELTQRIRQQYCKRHRTSPSPTIDGVGQTREILGIDHWKAGGEITLRRDADATLTINAGDLHGITVGSVFAIVPPVGQPQSPTPIGHVSVISTTPIDAKVEPCEFDGRPLVKDFPEAAQAQVAFKDYRGRQLRLHIESTNDLKPADRSAIELARLAVAPLAVGENGIVELVSDPKFADWTIWADDGRLSLIDATGKSQPHPLVGGSGRELQSNMRQLFERISRSINLLRLAGFGESERSAGHSEIQIQVDMLRHRSRTEPGEIVPDDGLGMELAEGELVSFRIKNTGTRQVDVTLFGIDPTFKMVHFFPAKRFSDKTDIMPGKECQSQIVPIVKPFGRDQLIAIAVPSQFPPVDFSWLADDDTERSRSPGAARGLQTSLGRLLDSQLDRTGTTRGLGSHEVKDVGMRLIQWRSKAKTGATP